MRYHAVSPSTICARQRCGVGVSDASPFTPYTPNTLHPTHPIHPTHERQSHDDLRSAAVRCGCVSRFTLYTLHTLRLTPYTPYTPYTTYTPCTPYTSVTRAGVPRKSVPTGHEISIPTDYEIPCCGRKSHDNLGHSGVHVPRQRPGRQSHDNLLQQAIRYQFQLVKRYQFQQAMRYHAVSGSPTMICRQKGRYTAT